MNLIIFYWPIKHVTYAPFNCPSLTCIGIQFSPSRPAQPHCGEGVATVRMTIAPSAWRNPYWLIGLVFYYAGVRIQVLTFVVNYIIIMLIFIVPVTKDVHVFNQLPKPPTS